MLKYINDFSDKLLKKKKSDIVAIKFQEIEQEKLTQTYFMEISFKRLTGRKDI